MQVLQPYLLEQSRRQSTRGTAVSEERRAAPNRCRRFCETDSSSRGDLHTHHVEEWGQRHRLEAITALDPFSTPLPPRLRSREYLSTTGLLVRTTAFSQAERRLIMIGLFRSPLLVTLRVVVRYDQMGAWEVQADPAKPGLPHTTCILLLWRITADSLRHQKPLRPHSHLDYDFVNAVVIAL